jgi:hypothetical protein
MLLVHETRSKYFELFPFYIPLVLEQFFVFSALNDSLFLNSFIILLETLFIIEGVDPAARLLPDEDETVFRCVEICMSDIE